MIEQGIKPKRPTKKAITELLGNNFPGEKFDVVIHKSKVIEIRYTHGPAKNKVREMLKGQEGEYHISVYRVIDAKLYDMIFEAAKEEFGLPDITKESPEWSILGCKAEEALDATDLSIAPGEEVIVL